VLSSVETDPDIEMPKPRSPTGADFAMAALFAQPFMIHQIIARSSHRPTATQWSYADPILSLLPHDSIVWLFPAIGVVITLVWMVMAFPSAAEVRRAIIATFIAVTLVGGGMLAYLTLKGPYLPRWLVVEEAPNARALGPLAGYAEEMLIRTGVLPLVYLWLGDRKKWLAIVGASLIAGLAFALLHEGGDATFSVKVFALRVLIPGFALSVLALLTKPTFVVFAHGTFHVVLMVFF
jgi:hypothetical protein